MVHSATIEITTRKNKEIVDLTGDVRRVVSGSKVLDGVVVVFATYTTTGLFINERESGLLKDVESVLSGVVPPAQGYLHDRVDDNAASHIQSILLSTSLTVPVEGGSLCLGTWQSIFLAERDGPRRRSVIVTVVGDRA